MFQRPAELLFVITCLMILVVIGIILTPQVENSQGFYHPDFAEDTLLQAPVGKVRHQKSIWLASAFGVLTVLALAACLQMGLNDEAKKTTKAIYSFSFAYSILMVVLVFIYWRTADQEATYILGFPISSMFMLYPFGLFPLVFVFLYSTMFGRWIFTAESEKRFQQLLAARKES